MLDGNVADMSPDSIRELEAENARLRQQLADVTESMGRVDERCAQLREQNGKLQRLLLYMWDFSCVVPDEPHTSKEELDYSVEVWRRMRELGVDA